MKDTRWQFGPGRKLYRVTINGQTYEAVMTYPGSWNAFRREDGGAIYLGRGNLAKAKSLAVKDAGVKRRRRTYVFDGHPMRVKSVKRRGNVDVVTLAWR